MTTEKTYKKYYYKSVKTGSGILCLGEEDTI